MMSTVPTQNLKSSLPTGGVRLKLLFSTLSRDPNFNKKSTDCYSVPTLQEVQSWPPSTAAVLYWDHRSEGFHLKWSLSWGRRVQHHLKKTQVSKHLLALEFMHKNSCLGGFIFYVKGLCYKSHEPHKSDLTPAPWVRLGPIYGTREQCVYLFCHLAFILRGALGELACTGQGAIHEATINPPVTSNPPWVENLDSTTEIGCLAEDAYSQVGTALGWKARVTATMSGLAPNTANCSY